MKILFPATHYYPVIGGLEIWTRQIAERLSKKAEIFVVTGKIKNQPLEENLNGVKIWRTSFLTLSNLSVSPLFYILSLLPFVFFRSLALIKKENIRLLHCQGFLSSFLGYLLSRITRTPYIVTVQRLESKNWLKKSVYRRAAYCIAASSAIKKYFEEIGCKNIEIIPNGIDLGRFENLFRQPRQAFTVMTVARLEKVKGIEYLIRAVRDFQLLIIGKGSERKNLENLVKKLGLEEKVKFLGEIPNEKIPSYLVQADCFVLSSLKEGFGIVVLEALAAGLPVIGTNVGGIKDIIENGKTGILVEPKNPEAIANAVDEIRYGRKFVKADLAKYDWQNIAEKVYEIYHRYGNISA